MQLPHISTPLPGDGHWQRASWSGQADPGDSFAPVKIGRDPATVTASITSVPAGARVRFQHSADGKRGWTELDSNPAAFFRQKPGDTVEWRGLSGFIRPVLDTKNAGPIAISVTVAPQVGQHTMTGAVA